MLTSYAFIINITTRIYLFLGVSVTTLYREISYSGGGGGIDMRKSTQNGYYASRTIVVQIDVYWLGVQFMHRFILRGLKFLQTFNGLRHN